MKRARALLVAFIVNAVLHDAAAAMPSFARFPSPSVRHYQYQVVQTINGTQRKGYRTEFDLVSDGKSVSAIIRHTAELEGESWKTVEPDPACRKEMHGDNQSIAQLQLFPLSQATAHDLGASFLPLCAPGAVFFPLTDILNAVIIPLSDEFRAKDLNVVGKPVHFQGFTAAYDRAGNKISERVPGGEVRLVGRNSRDATIDWLPQTAELTTVSDTPRGPMTLKGTEQWAFRVELDRADSSIERAWTTYDRLDLAVVGAPPSVPRVQISRAVTIQRL